MYIIKSIKTINYNTILSYTLTHKLGTQNDHLPITSNLSGVSKFKKSGSYIKFEEEKVESSGCKVIEQKFWVK